MTTTEQYPDNKTKIDRIKCYMKAMSAKYTNAHSILHRIDPTIQRECPTVQREHPTIQRESTLEISWTSSCTQKTNREWKFPDVIIKKCKIQSASCNYNPSHSNSTTRHHPPTSQQIIIATIRWTKRGSRNSWWNWLLAGCERCKHL